MTRTNIEIEEKLIRRVMTRHGFRSKREAVDRALRRLDVAPMTRDEALAMEGDGWAADVSEMRRPDRSLDDWLDEDEPEHAA